MALLSPGKKNDSSRDFRQISLLAVVPALLLAGPLVGFFAGQWLDGKFDTAPALMIVGVILGFGAAGVEIYGLVKKSSAMEKDDERKSGSKLS